MTFTRRRFLSSLGLGASAQVLLPAATAISRSVWAESGPVPTPKNIVFLGLGGALPDLQLGWPSRRPTDPNDHRKATSFTDWDYHEALAPLAPWRAQTVILRNLSLGLSDSQHSGGFGLLSGRGFGDSEKIEGHSPVAQSIDQLIAERMVTTAPIRSVLFGIDANANKLTHEALFAKGANQPVSFPVQASRLFTTLFPTAAGAEQRATDRRVLARVSSDVNRMRSRLASSERGQLDEYLASLEAFDKRRSTSPCLTPNAPTTERGPVKEVPAMLDMAATALRCGMTNVVGGAISCGNTHYHFAKLVGPHVGTMFEAQGFVGEHGHDGDEKHTAGRTIAWKWFSTEIAAFLRQLELPGVNGTPVLDDTVVVLFADNAHNHHNLENSNWRFIVIAGRNVPLRTGGRMLSFAWDVSWEPLNANSRSVASLYCSLATAVGVPLTTFADGGGARTNGPLAELM